MPQTSFTPGHVQSDDSRPHQSLLDEIQRLKEAHERAQCEIAILKEDCEQERAEKLILRIDLKKLRSLSHGTSSDQISIQQWQDRAEKAERRAEKAERRAEEAERRAEEAKLEVYKMRNVNFPRLIGSISQVFAEEMGLDTKSVKEESVPEDEGEADRLFQAIAQASEGEEIDYQGQQSDQASEGENEEHSSTHDPDQEIADGEYAVGQAHHYFSMRYRGTQESGPLPTYDPDTLSSLEDNSQYGSSKILVSLSPVLESGSPQELSFKDLSGTSLQPLLPPSPPPPSMSSQQIQSLFRLMGETTRPSDQHTPSANDTGRRSGVTNPLENLGDMQEALPTLSGSSKPKEQDFPDLPKGSPQIPGIPSESTAPPISKKPTLIPPIVFSTWDRIGPVNKKGTDGSRGIDASYFAGWGDEEDSDTGDQAEEQKPKTEISGKKSVAAGKQPERPSPAKEASSATGGDPPKPISTKPYAGMAQASPSKVQETAQSSRTGLKSGNAAAKAAAPQTDAPPADEANSTSGFPTVQPRKSWGPSDRGRRSLGRGEAGSNKGGHQQGPNFGQLQYHGRGGQGGNQKGGDREGGNQGASQGQVLTSVAARKRSKGISAATSQIRGKYWPRGRIQ